jgi:D-alanyl-D-alanine carboxypeptidase
MRKPLLFLIACLLGLTAMAAGAVAYAPRAAAQEAPAPPAIAARAAVLINADDGTVLYSLNPDERLAMASTTKMMTALLTIENCKDLSQKVTASERAATVGESSIYLTTGETLTVEEMLNGMLIPSGNDAATALAEFDAGSVEAFVDKMNKRAAELGMTNTHFANPHGLDDPDHYTSAADFAKLGTEVMKHPELREIVERPVFNIPQAGNPAGREIINNNHLLEQYPYINGIKTGFTDNAGQCIVISGNDNDVHLILSYLGGPSLSQRGTDVVNLLQFGFDSYQQRKLITAGQDYAAIDVPYDWGRQLKLVADADLTRQVYVKEEVDRRVVLPDDDLKLPVHKGDKVGLVEVYDGDQMLGSTYLVATEDVEAPGLIGRLGFYLSSFLHKLTGLIGF